MESETFGIITQNEDQSKFKSNTAQLITPYNEVELNDLTEAEIYSTILNDLTKTHKNEKFLS